MRKKQSRLRKKRQSGLTAKAVKPQPKKPSKPVKAVKSRQNKPRPKMEPRTEPKTQAAPSVLPIATKSDDESPRIQTAVDQLMVLVKDRGGVTFAEAAAALNAGTENIEEWGRILEEHGLVRLHYPAMGKPMLLPALSKKHRGQGEPAEETKQSPEKEETKAPRSKKKKSKKLFLVPVAILAVAVAVLRRNGTLTLPATPALQPVTLLLIVLLVFVIVLLALRKRIKFLLWRRRMGLNE